MDNYFESIKIKTNSSCNNNCIYCDNLNIKAYKNKSLEDIKKEIIESQHKNIKEIILPCNSDSRPDFLKLLKFLKSINLKIILETNGRLFSYITFTKTISKYIDHFIIYFFGHNKEIYENISQVKNSWNQALLGEKNIKKYGKSYEIKELFIPHLEHPVSYDKPIEVVIEVTPKCNFNCLFCFNKISFAKKNRNIEIMSTEYIKEIIDSIANSDIKYVRFSGGEPLEREDIFELMDYAQSKNLHVWMNSNATLVTENNIQQIEKYVENILVPMNGFNSNTDFKWTNTTKSFENKITGLKILKKSKIPVVRSGTVATKENIENLEKIYSIIKKYNLDEWEVYRPISTSIENIEPFNIEKLYSKLIKLSFDYGRLISLANSIPFCYYDIEKMNILCLGAKADDGHSRIIVDPKGFAKPSYFLHKDIGDPRNIIKCWNHEFMKKMRNLEFLPKECKNCLYKNKCKGGSRYAAYLSNNSYSALDPFFNNSNKK